MVDQTSILPIINSPEHYRELFKNNSIWEPAIQWICQKHQLNHRVLRSESGSHIVYRAGDFWIKLMAPIYQKEMVFEVAGLKSVSGRLSVKTPEIIAQDSIQAWPYVILTDVPGVAIKSGWSQMNQIQQHSVLSGMAKTIIELSRCSPDDVIKQRFDWNEFITGQYQNCYIQQTKKKMPEPWLSQVKPFLQNFSLSEFTTENPVFLHCDLSYDHFFIDQGRLSGIIDLADVQCGHPEYELAAPCVFVFKGDRSSLRLFLNEVGYNHLDQKFSEKLLAWCLLHRYFGMSTFFKSEMDSCHPGDFAELANKVFPL